MSVVQPLLCEQAKSAESQDTASISAKQMSAFEPEKRLEKTFIFENYFAFYKSAHQNNKNKSGTLS